MVKIQKPKNIKRIKRRIQDLKAEAKQTQKREKDFAREVKKKLKNPFDGMIMKKFSKVNMTDVIFEFGEPLLEKFDDIEERHRLVSTVIMLWNVSLLPKKEQQKNLVKLSKEIPSTQFDPEHKSDVKLFDFFMDRKKRLFSNINRYIVRYKCSITPKGLHLNIVSSDSYKNV